PVTRMLHQSISAANFMQSMVLAAVTVSNPLTLSTPSKELLPSTHRCDAARDSRVEAVTRECWKRNREARGKLEFRLVRKFTPGSGSVRSRAASPCRRWHAALPLVGRQGFSGFYSSASGGEMYQGSHLGSEDSRGYFDDSIQRAS